jgi:hypothetical protein
MSTLQRAKLGDIAYVGSTAASIYANAASTITLVVGISLHNTNTTAEVVQVYNVPDSGGSLGTAGNGNRFLKVTLQADESLFVEIPYGIILTDTNDSLQAVTTTASKVTVMVHGDKIL